MSEPTGTDGLVESIRQLLDIHGALSRPDGGVLDARGPHAGGEPSYLASQLTSLRARGAAKTSAHISPGRELPVMLGSFANIPERSSWPKKEACGGLPRRGQPRAAPGGDSAPWPREWLPREGHLAPHKVERGCCIDGTQAGPDAFHKGSAPAEMQGLAEAADEWEGVSTVKLLNLPRRCTKQEILAVIEELGFGDAYDFFCLPMGTRSKQNHGYAFMNFKDPSTASEFRRVASGRLVRSKVISVTVASLQGLEQNWEHFNRVRALSLE